ncbi:MAG: ribonuclease R [Proteobacteria bacterium]|nr:ribonuclease R [Pseudomonadota bacterium]
MRKKRKHFPRKPSDRHPASRIDRKSLRLEKTLERDVLTYVYRCEHPVSQDDIGAELKLDKDGQKELTDLLVDLVEQKILNRTSKHRFSLGKQNNLATGVLDQNPRGFGFVTGLSVREGSLAYSRDPSVEAFHMGAARHGDTVLVRVCKVRQDGRPEAEVISVLERGSDRLAGFVSFEQGKVRVTPEDPHFPFSVVIDGKIPEDLSEGYAVIVQLVAAAEDTSRLRGKIIEVLGDPDSIDVQMRLVIEKFKLPHAFSKEAMHESAQLPEEITETKGREDLRETLHVTIDGETAKDFDDAVAVVKTKRGFRLYVSIADVSHFVRPGTALDKDAYERGTSIYFPGRVIPMLPEKISNNLCSLIPDQDRLAFTAILDFDRQGNTTGKRFVKSIIRSHKRFTYTTVRQILIDNNQEVRREHKPFLTPLKWAGELAIILQKLRKERGAIGFTLPEPEIGLDDSGRINSIGRAERNFAHQLIEQFMLSANEAVAETFTEHSVNALYRIHERPDPIKVQEFTGFAQTLGLNLPKHREDPDWFGQVLDMVKNSPKEYVVNNLLLRTMQQARYDMRNVGHFGLAATDYTHFTSPIRRYPDLLVHRALYDFISKSSENKKNFSPENLKNIGPFLSTRERLAVSAEREMNDRLKVRYMQNKVGESFDAVISGVSGFALFVELLELFISGAVVISELRDDYYNYDQKHHRLVGERSSKVYRMGDLVRVTLLDVDLRKNRINFTLAKE